MSWIWRGSTQLFSGRYVRAGFSNLGGLWADKLPWRWGLVSRLSSKTGAWELIIYQKSKLLMKIGAKLVLLELKIAIFSGNCWFEAKLYIYLSNEGLVNRLEPQLGSCKWQEVWKGSLEGCTSPYPLFMWGPPPPSWIWHIVWWELVYRSKFNKQMKDLRRGLVRKLYGCIECEFSVNYIVRLPSKRVTFWFQHVRSLPCAYAALYECETCV